ncbi:MAG: peptidase U32 family protein [Ketobacteraceae bacterium]|nr:peptidase U32 family protein [Ketobacteraceae bacterium]
MLQTQPVPDGASLELVCPAGTPAAFRTALDAGADAIYVGFRDETNARNYPGLNFSRQELATAVPLAHQQHRKVFVAINTNPHAGNQQPWQQAVDDAVSLGADAVILSDPGLIDYTRNKYPDFQINLSVQAFASNIDSINYYRDQFGIARVVLPRIFTLREIRRIVADTDVEIEVFAFAVAGPMAEGRCIMSSYVTGKSPNNFGACSPASCVEYTESGSRLDSRLNGVLVNRFEQGEPASYPTLCRGRYRVNGQQQYLFENPASLNVISILGKLTDIGVRAIKIEGRQRGKSYIADVTRQFRLAIDNVANSGPPLSGEPDINEDILAGLCEGQDDHTGAFKKRWL